MATIDDCGCAFCKAGMTRYICFEVMAGAYDISCPDQECEKQGVVKVEEVENIAGKDVGEKYMRFRLNTGEIKSEIVIHNIFSTYSPNQIRS